jgi:hypothetical protein
MSPRLAAWILGALTAIGVAGSVYRIPMQVSDSLEVVERVVSLPSAAAAFRQGLGNSTLMLRPLKEVRTKLLVEVGERLGDRFHLVFRGYHALAGAVLIALVVWVCRVRSWTDVAALACSLAILTGAHTFAGLFRESFPVNHFLLVAIFAVAAFALSQGRGGRFADAAGILLFVIATLTFETGLLVWIVAAAAFAAGARGLSTRAMLVMTLLLAAYVGLRVGYLSQQPVGYGQRTTGFGAGTITADEQFKRFSGNPVPFWAYNVSMSAVSVLLSQPTAGQWTVVRAWQQGSVPPVYFVEIGSSVTTTVLVLWYLGGRGPSGRRRWREPLPMTFVLVLGASAALSYAYAKDEIVSSAGVFYALLAYAALRETLTRRPVSWRAVPVALLVVALSGAWAMRAAGLHLKLRHAAFDARSDWAFVLYPANRPRWPADPHTLRIVTRMREESMLQRTIAPALLPAWTELWWGDD